MKYAITLLLILISLLVHAFIANVDSYNIWSQECRLKKGVVSSVSSFREECIVGGEVIILDYCKTHNCN